MQKGQSFKNVELKNPYKKEAMLNNSWNKQTKTNKQTNKQKTKTKNKTKQKQKKNKTKKKHTHPHTHTHTNQDVKQKNSHIQEDVNQIHTGDVVTNETTKTSEDNKKLTKSGEYKRVTWKYPAFRIKTQNRG